MQTHLTEESDGKPQDQKLQGPARVEDIAGEDDDDDIYDGPTITSNAAVPIVRLADTEGKLKEWVDYARQVVARHCKLFADPGSSTGISALLKQTSVGGMRGEPGSHYAGVF